MPLSYQGKKKDREEVAWDQKYGHDNWRIAWDLPNGERWDYLDVFENEYVAGYEKYFFLHPDEAVYLTENFAYAYDKGIVDSCRAYDPVSLYNRPGHPNQFHHAALNLALRRLRPFKGTEPIQVREGRPGTPRETWPKGWRWSPGRIPSANPALITPPREIPDRWWRKGTIEDFYQSNKVLVVRRVSVLPKIGGMS